MIPRQKLGEDSARRQDQPGGSFVSDKALAVGWLPQKNRRLAHCRSHKTQAHFKPNQLMTKRSPNQLRTNLNFNRTADGRA